jgi:hypothetical protein
MALRIVHALSVHRLTTNDIHVPLGATPEELRDDLCLYVDMPESTAEFLLDQVQVALREIMRTVSGQYISFNEANGQYYLDVKKDIDFDAKIKERGEFMEEEDLNRYFFDALRQTLNLSDTTYVTGHRIWFYELPWAERKVTRPGYLFFGAPDERSTAQPPRDFYVYVLPPFLHRAWKDEARPDEVIFQLTGLDQAFADLVRLYAGARAMANEAATHRQVYAEKADEHLRRLNRWLRDHLTSQLQVTYQGVTEPVSAVLARTRSSASQTLEDLLRLLASHLLAPEFQERYPDYPAFTRAAQPISEAGRATAAMDAIHFLAGRRRTQLALAVLDGLRLVDGEGHVRPHDSPYARRYLDLLQNKPEGQVVNRGEVITQVAGGIQPVEKDIFFQLEPEWVAVVLVALAQHGDIVLNLGGQAPLDASNLDRAASIAIADLTDFRFYSRPRALPVDRWVMIFEGLGLPAGLIRDENSREEAVRRLQPTVQAELERTARVQGRIQQGVQLWNTALFTDRPTFTIEAGAVVGSDLPPVTLSMTDLLPGLRGYKAFLDELSRFNAVGKLRNLQLTTSEITDALNDRQVVERAEQWLALVEQLQPLTAYLAEAQANLPPEHPWAQRAAAAQQDILAQVRRLGKGEAAPDGQALVRELEALKAEYVKVYSEFHRQLRLGPQADQRRQRLYNDPRLAALNALSAIDLLPTAELEGWKQAISSPLPCPEFHEGVLNQGPTCPYCRLRPAQQQRLEGRADLLLDVLDERLDDLLRRWRQALRSNLQSETAQHSLAAMTPMERWPIDRFLEQSDDAPDIPENFVPVAIQALRGITALPLRVQDLLEALKAGGLPCTLDEFRRRFNAFVDQAMHGHDPRNTRLMLE